MNSACRSWEYCASRLVSAAILAEGAANFCLRMARTSWEDFWSRLGRKRGESVQQSRLDRIRRGRDFELGSRLPSGLGLRARLPGGERIRWAA